MKVPKDFPLELLEVEKFVSRGGYKLEAALDRFGIVVQGRVCADVGASTGGFTDCLLQRGAKLVYAVDVGDSTLHRRLRGDGRVRVLDHTNARHLNPAIFTELPSFVAVDVSFISVTKILPAVRRCVAAEGQCVALIKPQFEATREEVSRGRGVIREPAVHKRILEQLLRDMPLLGWHAVGLMVSPILGGQGNREYLAWLEPGKGTAEGIDVDRLVHEAFLIR
jgi:23S rRNA (cytidine1920-2'-O)/16S rRNA (cytidine1409-2'-O)-methyltransferase